MGAWGSAALNNGIDFNSQAYSQESDFVNNLVFRFGKNQNQSLQFLYYTNADQIYDNYAGSPIPYDNLSPFTIDYVQAGNREYSHWRRHAGQRDRILDQTGSADRFPVRSRHCAAETQTLPHSRTPPTRRPS